MSDSVSGSNSAGSVSRDQERQIDDLKSAHEKKMARLRAEQQKEESELRMSGDAAINHIRKSTDERVESVRAQAEAKIEREDDSISKNYASLKRRSSQTNESAEKDIAAAKERADRSIEANRSREDRVLEQSQEKLKEFLARQRELRARTEKSSAEEITEAQRRGSETLRKASDSNSRELREIETEHREKIGELKERDQSSYANAKTEAEKRLSRLRQENELRLKRERDEANAAYTSTHQKAHDEVVREQQTGKQKLALAAAENQRKLEENRDRSLATNEKTQAEYSKEGSRIEQLGSRDLQLRQEKFDKLKHTQEAEQKAELKEIKTQNLEKEKQIRAEHEAHVQETVEKLSQTLTKQTEQFQKKFETDAKVNRESLNNQKELFLKAQYKQKAAQARSTGLEESRAGDMFYTPKTFDASLIENPDHYVLTAKVPAYEKDNVDVRIKDNKVVLSGTRSFQDQFKDGDSRTETSAHQTYRQEFSLAKPADAKHVMTSIKDDGTITAIIPKKGFEPRKA